MRNAETWAVASPGYSDKVSVVIIRSCGSILSHSMAAHIESEMLSVMVACVWCCGAK